MADSYLYPLIKTAKLRETLKPTEHLFVKQK